jgi:hypothetical protein
VPIRPPLRATPPVTYVRPCAVAGMKLEVELPDKYGEKLEEIETVEPTIREQIEVEVLPQVLRLINDGYRQLDGTDPVAPRVEAGEDSED